MRICSDDRSKVQIAKNTHHGSGEEMHISSMYELPSNALGHPDKYSLTHVSNYHSEGQCLKRRAELMMLQQRTLYLFQNPHPP